MAVEIECKVKVDSLFEISDKLGELGAEFAGYRLQRDAYFCDLADVIINSDKAIRLRLEECDSGRRSVMTYKGPKQNTRFKSREEHEVEISDIESAGKILSGLGLEERIVIEKKRFLWQLEDCRVCLDELPLIGFFVEIEGPNENAVAVMMEKIGIDGLEHITASYASMIQDKLKELGIDKKEVTF